MLDAVPKKKRRGGPRRKTGCYTCKSRHSRCDERKPICGNCERLNLECKPFDVITPSEWNQSLRSTTPAERGTRQAPSTQPELDASSSIDAPTSTWDVFRSHIPELDVAGESSPTQNLTMLNLPTPPSTSRDVRPTIAVSLTSETAFLLQTYLGTVATWMDLMDFDLTYQLSIPRLTLSSPLLFHSVCAYTAKYLSLSNSRHHSSWDSVARHHYGQSLNHLISTLNSPAHEHALTATILVSSYEVINSLSVEHRRHFLGAMMLIRSHNISAQSTGINRANFWIYVRHEIVVALSSEKPLVLHPDDWNVQWKQNETREDILGNQMLWILARVINLIYGKQGTVRSNKLQREGFLHELEDWKAGLSDPFIGIPYGEEDEDGFRKIYFTVTAAAAAAFWYHIAHILLYTEPELQDESYREQVQDQAIRVANIALSEFPDSLKVFSSHGLYHAAKHIDGIARKARIWNVLNDVESQLGYHTRSIVKRLQRLAEKG